MARENSDTTWTLTKVPLPMRFRPESPWSDDELMAFSAANECVRVERESDGTIMMMTPAGGEGNRRENFVARELDVWAEQDGRGVAFGYNAGFSLPDGALLSPDAAWVWKDDWLALTPSQREKFLPFCPAFVVEVMSASDSLSEAEVKMRRWMANGAELGWLIDPYAAAVTVFRTGAEMERMYRPESMHGQGPVDGFVLKMERLWA
jgi:Uma2 family endonuclease